MVDTSQISVLGYMEVVDQRDAATLLPIISEPGTIIWLDGWAAYNGIAALPGVTGHGIVNHSILFVHPRSGVNINTIESYWDRYVLLCLMM